MNFEDVRKLAQEMGPLVSFCTVSADGTPHVVPVMSTWDDDVLMFGSRATSVKVRHVRAQPRTAVQVLTLGAPFPDALLMKGVSEIVDDDRKRGFWESGLFPFLPRLYPGWDDPALVFVRFTVLRASLSLEGGRGEVRRWEGAQQPDDHVHPGG